MNFARWTPMAVSTAALISAAGPSHALITSSWVDSSSAVPGFVKNELEVFTTQDWISTQLLVQLNTGQLHYVTQGVVPSLNPTLLVGAAANTSLSFPAAGNAADPLNSQISGFELVPNVGTGGTGGLGGSTSAVVNLTTFDLTYFGPPSETDDITAGTPLMLARMTASTDAFGTWAIRIANTDSNDTLFANGYVFKGIFYNGQIPADLDNDGDVDDADFGIAFAAFTGPNNGPSNNPLADLDMDNDVDDADFGLAFASFTGPIASATVAVPEPGTGVLFFAGLTVFSRRRKRYFGTADMHFLSADRR